MKKLKLYTRHLMLLTAILSLVIFAGCNDATDPDPKVEDPIASFQYEVDATEFLKVTFTNFSQNATSYAWDFGDGSGTSTDESPTYTFTADGSFTVVLTATNSAGVSASKSETILLKDPLAAQRVLIGDNGKTWQLIADASTGVNSYQVGPADRGQIWWSLGGVEKLCVRECILDDTWTFNADGTFTFENNGDFWGEGAFKEELLGKCFDASVAANFVGPNGEDLSAWNSGSHGYTYDPVAGKLTVNGGFIGIPKAADNAEVTVPATSVTYTVVKMVDATVDTMVVETYIDGGYWQSTLVSYDNASDKVVISECESTTGGETTDNINYDFESGDAAFDAFGNDNAALTAMKVANPVSGGINTSANVIQVDQAIGVEGWAGIAWNLDAKVDFSTKMTFKMKVYSPAVGQVIKFKLEEQGNGGNNKEVDATTTVANAYEVLTFTFTADDSAKWNRLALFFNFEGAVKAGATVHYFDDIVLE